MKSQNTIKLILLLLVFNFNPLVSAQSDYKIAEQDSLALVAFYNATDGPNWVSNQDGFGMADLTSEWQLKYTGNFNNWLEGPVKDWFGVTVEKVPTPNSSDSSYRVVRIWPVIGRRTDGQNNMSGYIPREVAYLTALEDFSINGNSGFDGSELPDEIFHATLENIDVESAGFTGDIPDALTNCVTMRKMNFRYNPLDYMPSYEFLDKEALYNLNGGSWFYSTQISLAIFEKSIDYFYTISPNAKEFSLEMRDVTNVGDEMEVVAAVGASVDLECVSAGEKEDDITYQWYKNGLSKYGKTKRNYTFSSVKESDYADYTVKITNDYVKDYDQNSNWGEIYTKVIHLVAAPVAPVVEWAKTSYNGKAVQLRLSKPMNTEAAGFAGFSITAGSRTIEVVAAMTDGRLNKDLILTLGEEIKEGETLSLAYSGTEVVDMNNGVLASLSDTTIENLVRTEPAVLMAQTTKDGSGIELFFDNYIDASSIDVANFEVIGDHAYSLVSATLQAGDLNADISKVVLLSLATPVADSTEVIKVNYSKGHLSGYLSGVSAAFSDLSVKNQVILDNTEVLFVFEDGSGDLDDVMMQASWSLNPIQMYDDGTNGDVVANDNRWTRKTALVDDKYTWDVISRETIQSYDTVSTVDPVTGVISQTITPQDIYNDLVLSESVILEFDVKDDSYTGLTSFGIMNISVTFNLTLNESSEEVFLMGINGDWTTGVPMTRVGTSFVYTATLGGYTQSDVLSFNYRNGDVWENSSAVTRSHTVIDGENVIANTFSIFSALKAPAALNVNLYPNPTNGLLHLTTSGRVDHLEIYNLSGQVVYSQNSISTADVSIDVSSLEGGIYYMRIAADNGAVSSRKFVKIK